MKKNKLLIGIFIALCAIIMFSQSALRAARPNTSIKVWEWSLSDTLEPEANCTTTAISVVIPGSKSSKAQYTAIDYGYVIYGMEAHANDSIIGDLEVWAKAPSYIPEWGDTVFYEYRHSDSDSIWRDSSLTDTLPPITPYASRSDRWVFLDSTYRINTTVDSLLYTVDYSAPRNAFRTYLPPCDSIRFIFDAVSKSDSLGGLTIFATLSGNSSDKNEAIMINKFIGTTTAKDTNNYSTHLAEIKLWDVFDQNSYGANFNNIAYSIYLVAKDTAAANDSISVKLNPYFQRYNAPVGWLGLAADSSGRSFMGGNSAGWIDTLQGEDYYYGSGQYKTTGLSPRMRIELQDFGSEDSLRWIWFNALITR
jgi:hypothetical protein